jgi:PEP-CTERM motif
MNCQEEENQMSLVWKKITAATAALVAFASVAHANIIYDVKRGVGPNGSVVGFIETDGTLGTLATSNILNWNLLLGDSSGTFFLDGTLNSQIWVNGTAYTATASTLDFDFFGATNAFVLIQNPFTGSGQNWWCIEAQASSCAGLGTGETVRVGTNMIEYNPEAFGPIGIARTEVPEPASIALLGAGLAGLGMARRRKI